MAGETKSCPHCGEEILAVAKKCKHCHEKLEDDSASSPPSDPTLPLDDGTIPLPDVKRILGGRYELFDELGRGGMGIVYKARDTKLNTDVAIKLLPEYLANDTRGVDFLKREALASMKLSHPNILRLHHFEDHPEAKFLIMEFVDGKNLSQIQSESPNHKLFEEQVIKYAIEACKALEYAHSERVIHRDIKPSNIMVDSSGRLKIADFGIARIVKDSHTRHTGTVSGGTLLYMSPEQIEGDKVDARSDIYSLGISLYELLNGEVPFSSGDITHQHLRKDPLPIDGISGTLNKIILKCLEKKPENRFQSVAELQNALEGKAVPSVQKPQKKKGTLALAALAVLAIAVVVGIAYIPNRKVVKKAREAAAKEREMAETKTSSETRKKAESVVPAKAPEKDTKAEAIATPPKPAEKQEKQLAKTDTEKTGTGRTKSQTQNVKQQPKTQQATGPETSSRTRTRSTSPSLMGSWQGPMELAYTQMVFQSENTLFFDGEQARYTLLPGVIRIQDEFGTEDYPYTLQGNTLTLTFPEGLQFQFTRIGGAPAAQSVSISDQIFQPAPVGDQPFGGATPTDQITTAAATPAVGSSSVAGGEIGDPNWGFKFKPPAGWKSQKSAEGVLLGHDTIAGAIVVIPHIASSFQEVQMNMQNGLVEGSTKLFPSGNLQPLGNDAVAGEYAGMFDGAQAKARGIGTLSPYGGGAYIIGVTTPDKYGKQLASAADVIAKNMQYFQVEISELVRHFTGTWVHLTANTMTSVTLAANGDYIEDYEASYGGQFNDQYGFDAGNWGATGQDSSRARWTVRGTLREGVLIITYPDGSQDTVTYQVYVSRGETYWREYLFNGVHYRKR